MINQDDFSLCLKCVGDLPSNKHYTLDDFVCIPTKIVTPYYNRQPSHEREIEAFCQLQNGEFSGPALTSDAAVLRWMSRRATKSVISRRHKLCVALSATSTRRDNNLYLLRPSSLLDERAPFFTVVCVSLSVRRHATTNKKTEPSHFQVHTHVVKNTTMASAHSDVSDNEDGETTLNAIDQLNYLLLNENAHQGPPSTTGSVTDSAGTKKQTSRGKQLGPPPPSAPAKKRAAPGSLAPTKKAKTTMPPPADKQPVVAPAVKVTCPNPYMSIVRVQQGDNAPVTFDIATHNGLFSLKVRPDSTILLTNAD